MERREILFRGQTRRYGEKVKNATGEPMESNWVYGGIFPNNDGGDFAIIYQQEPDIKKFSVYADTVGQYTGLTDKNGKKIFEGDIVKIYPNCDYLEDFEISKVYSYNGVLCVDYHTSEYDATAIGFAYDIDETEFEVIGNIHDNPELIKE